jgi:hypothetical protein
VIVNTILSKNSNIIPLTTIPANPSVNAGTNPTQSSFIVNWSKVQGATGYCLDVSSYNDFRSYVSGYRCFQAGNTNKCTVSGLNKRTTYYSRVRASNGGGDSGYSPVMTVSTL